MNKSFVVSGKSEVSESCIVFNLLNEINGQKNTDVSSGLMYDCKDAEVSLRKSVIGPGGYLAPHKAPGVVCICVTKGSGYCGLTSQDDQISCRIAIAEGDILTFEKNMPLHFYEAGDAGLEYIAVSIPKAG